MFYRDTAHASGCRERDEKSKTHHPSLDRARLAHLEARRSRHGVPRIEEIRIDEGEFLLVQYGGVLLRLEGAARRTATSKF